MILLDSPVFVVIPAAALSAAAGRAGTRSWGDPGGEDLDRCAPRDDVGITSAIGPHQAGRAGGPGAHALSGNATGRRVARDAPGVSVEPVVFGKRAVEQRL